MSVLFTIVVFFHFYLHCTFLFSLQILRALFASLGWEALDHPELPPEGSGAAGGVALAPRRPSGDQAVHHGLLGTAAGVLQLMALMCWW